MKVSVFRFSSYKLVLKTTARSTKDVKLFASGLTLPWTQPPFPHFAQNPYGFTSEITKTCTISHSPIKLHSASLPPSLPPSLSPFLTPHSSLLTPHSSLFTPHSSILTPPPPLPPLHSPTASAALQTDSPPPSSQLGFPIRDPDWPIGASLPPARRSGILGSFDLCGWPWGSWLDEWGVLVSLGVRMGVVWRRV